MGNFALSRSGDQINCFIHLINFRAIDKHSLEINIFIKYIQMVI